VQGNVIVGIRPEDVHEPRGGDGAYAKLTAEIERVEALGSNLLAHFHVDAEPARTEGVAAATGGELLEEAPLIERRGASFIATFEPRSAVRVGDRVEVALDTRRLHFFDPETEESLT
jgi:multiple sugar transport system ATP-binding protein